jgi:hypothetical protein
VKTSTWLVPLVTAVVCSGIVWQVRRPPSPTRWVDVGDRCEVLGEFACAEHRREEWRAQCQVFPGSAPEDKNYWWHHVDEPCTPGACRNNRCGGR